MEWDGKSKELEQPRFKELFFIGRLNFLKTKNFQKFSKSDLIFGKYTVWLFVVLSV